MSVRTMTGATDSYTTGRITGIIHSIKVNTSASNDFTVSTTQSIITEYLLGSSGAGVTVSADVALYPRAIGVKNTDGSALGIANHTNAYQKMAISCPLKIDVSSGTAADTWSVEIVYED